MPDRMPPHRAVNLLANDKVFMAFWEVLLSYFLANSKAKVAKVSTERSECLVSTSYMHRSDQIRDIKSWIIITIGIRTNV